MNSSYKQKPSSEDYRFLIEMEWGDIHHSRVQEWSALGLIAGAHVGIISLLESVKELPENIPPLTLVIFTSITGIIFNIIGILLTMRHRRLMIIKLRWIYESEYKLGLIKNESNEGGIIPDQELDLKKSRNWRGLTFPRLLSTSGLIVVFYLALLALNILTIFIYGS